MPLTTFSANSTARASEVNANFALCVLTDTARTVAVTHTYSASQTFSAGWTSGAVCTLNTSATAIPSGIASVLTAANMLGTFAHEASFARLVVVAGAGVPEFNGVRVNTSFAAPSTMVSGSVMSRFNGIGYDGTTYNSGAGIDIVATQTWTASAHGTKMILQTTANGSVTATDTLVLQQDGSATFNGSVQHNGVVFSASGVATPSAYAATQGSIFASVVSGATLMGYGTTGDVTLKNRSGTDVLVVTSNTLNVTLAGGLSMASASASLTMTGSSTTQKYIHIGNTSGDAYFGIESSSAGGFFTGSGAYDTVIYTPTQPLKIMGGGTTAADITTFDAGTVTFGSAVAIGNTVNAVSPTSPNRTVTMVVGGVTLYLHAKTTND